jgi:hypothetical protein
MRTNSTDNSVLEAALIGYQFQLQMLSAKIREIKNRLGAKSVGQGSGTTRQSKKHQISPEGRARIAAAQKKRWAAAKRAKAAA